jgi:endoglucanase
MQDMISYLEGLIGRQFSSQRIYTNMSLNVPMGTDLAAQAQGIVDYHNINSFWLNGNTKTCDSWASVAAGTYDSWWITQAQNIKAWGYPVYLSFNHEPTVDSPTHPSCGTAPEYIAAYDHVVQLFAAQHVTNVKWVWTLTASTFNGTDGGPTAWEPSHYDVVGVDGYNHAFKWRTPQDVFQTAEDFARSRGKPLLIGEIGSDEQTGNPMGKANWITQAAALFKSYGNVVAVEWTNTGTGGNYWLDSSPQALAAFTAAGRDPYFA